MSSFCTNSTGSDKIDLGKVTKQQIRHNCKVFIDHLKNDIRTNCVCGSYVIVPRGLITNKYGEQAAEIIHDCLRDKLKNYELVKNGDPHINNNLDRDEKKLVEIDIKVYPKL